MNALRTFFEAGVLDAPWAERIGWVLLHSLWQIALIAGLSAVFRMLLRRSAAQARYLCGCVAMAAMLAAPMATYVLLPEGDRSGAEEPAVAATVLKLSAGAVASVEPGVALPVEIAVDPGMLPPEVKIEAKVVSAAAATELSEPAPGVLSTVQRWLPWATVVWLVGVILLSLRPVVGWLHVLRLQRRGLSPLPDSPRQAAAKLQHRLGVTRAVRFMESALVEVPTVVGALRPMVLLPAAAVSGLSIAQVEMILAHEVAHVRRHDYLVNLTQTVIEALLFFHPAVWWVSAQVRRERENCCDDIAVAVSGNREHYVQALTRLEEQRAASSVAVLVATGGSLLERVRRLLGQPGAEFGYRSASAWLAGLVAVGLVSLALATGDAPREKAENGSADDVGQEDAAPAPIEHEAVMVVSDREAMLAYARALAAGDLATLGQIWEFQDDLDRQFAEKLAGMFARAEEMRVDLVSMERLDESSLFACFLLRDAPEITGKGPQFVMFRRKDGEWRCSSPLGIRTLVNARAMGVEQLGRRAIAQKMAQLRFGRRDGNGAIATMKAQRDALARLTRPPYELAAFGRDAESLSVAIEKVEAEQKSWQDLWRLMLEEHGEEVLPRPGDFSLSFYLPADPADPHARKLPFPGPEKTFLAEPFPCLTDDAVREVRVEPTPGGKQARIELLFTSGGARLLEAVTRESIRKRLAIVVDGKVLAAPEIMMAIDTGKVTIEGSFTRQEADAIVEKLNSSRKEALKLIEEVGKEQGGGDEGAAEENPDNPLGLDNETLIRLFNTGKALRAAAQECVDYQAKHAKVPESAEVLFEDYQQFANDMIVDPFAAEGGVLRLTERMDGAGDNWLQVWSVGPDGDWDGGKLIDAADPKLDGDLGAEMRIGKWAFNWLADNTMAMHLDGKRLSHYLAAQGPEYPGAINPHQTLDWGPVVDGLCMAVKMVPEKESYALGEKIGLEFHVRNVSPYPITIAGYSWRQDGGPDSIVVRDDQGRKLQVTHAFYSGVTPIQRDTLQAGKVAVFKSSALAFLAEDMPRPEHPVGHVIRTEPGRHTMQFKLIFPDGYSSVPDGMPRPTDWQGTLQTAVETITVVASEEVVEKSEAAKEKERVADGMAEARKRFIEVERFARLPKAEQGKRLASFYHSLNPRSVNPMVEAILSSYPHHILNPFQKDDPFDGDTERWAQQLADAADELTVEQVADKLKSRLWLNIAARARALQVFKTHRDETIKLLAADLDQSRQRPINDKATTLIVSLDLREFTKPLLTTYMEKDAPSPGGFGALVNMKDPAILPVLLEKVAKEPEFLTRCSALFPGQLAGQSAPQVLLELLDSTDTEIRYHAAYALQECRDPALAEPAVTLAGEKQARFRVMAAQWIAKLPVLPGKVELAGGWWAIPKGKEQEYAARHHSGYFVTENEDHGKELVLTPGKHTIRVATICPSARASFHGVVRAVSNARAVEIGNGPTIRVIPENPVTDGIYRVKGTNSTKQGVKRQRSDATGTVEILERLTAGFGDVSITSMANDNSRFRIDFKGAGPFSAGDDIGQMAVVVDEYCVVIGSHSDPDGEQRMDLTAWHVNKPAANAIARKLGTKPEFRRDPGHKMDVTFSPTQPTFQPGDPVVLRMTIKNVGDKPFSFMDGGKQRGARNNQFGFQAFRDAGKGEEVPDTGDATNFGGLADFITLKPAEAFEKEVDISKWFDLSDPDTYLIRGHFEMVINDNWDAVASGETVVTVTAEQGASETAIPESVRAVLKAMKQDVLELSEKFPQLAAAATVEVKPDGWLFEHDCRYLGKRGYENTGEFPVAVGLRVMTTERFQDLRDKAAMAYPSFSWEYLGLVGWFTLHVGDDLPRELVGDFQEIERRMYEKMGTLNRQALSASLPDAIEEERDRLLAEADAQIRNGIIKLAATYPLLKKGQSWERLQRASESGPIAIYLRRSQQGKGRTDKEPFPPSEAFSVLVVVKPPSDRIQQLAHGTLYPSLGLFGQVNTGAANPQLEAALKKLVKDSLAPLAEFEARPTLLNTED